MKRFCAELLGTFALVFAGTGAIIINETSHGAISHVGIAVGSVIALEAMFAGPVCGASMNPARSFAPAIVSGQHLEHLWIYLAAPVLGAGMATVACRCVRETGCCSKLKSEMSL